MLVLPMHSVLRIIFCSLKALGTRELIRVLVEMTESGSAHQEIKIDFFFQYIVIIKKWQTLEIF